MLACNRCGQSPHLSNDNFLEYISITGTEKRYINPDNGEVEDYGDTDVSDYGDSEYYCPHCDSNDIDTDSIMEEDDAKELRKTYTERIKKEALERELALVEEKRKEAIAKTGWDF